MKATVLKASKVLHSNDENKVFGLYSIIKKKKKLTQMELMLQIINKSCLIQKREKRVIEVCKISFKIRNYRN